MCVQEPISRWYLMMVKKGFVGQSDVWREQTLSNAMQVCYQLMPSLNTQSFPNYSFHMLSDILDRNFRLLDTGPSANTNNPSSVSDRVSLPTLWEHYHGSLYATASNWHGYIPHMTYNFFPILLQAEKGKEKRTAKAAIIEIAAIGRPGALPFVNS